jgi:hypothetical protein
MTTSLQTTTWFRGAAWLLAIAAGAGCQIIAGIDRSDLGMSGVGGSAGSGGSTLIGTGGSSGSDQDADGVPDASTDDVSMPTDDTGVGGSSTLGTGGSAGAGGIPPTDGGGGTNNTGGSAGGGMTDGPVTDSGSLCAGAVPAGWTLVLHSATDAICPSTFGTAHEVFAATIGSTACTCTSCTTSAGTCAQGTASALVAPGSGNDACTLNWFSNVNVNGCTTVQAVGADHVQVTATVAATGSGGTCTPGAPTVNASQFTFARQSWCDVTTQQSDGVCGGTVAAGFSACIMRPGNVTCPPGSTFNQPAVFLHDTAMAGCSACSACSAQTSCTGGVLQGFAGTACGGTAIDLPFTAPPSCLDANPGETAIGSIRLTATPSTTCQNGTSTPAPLYTGTSTLCCR